MTQHKNADTQTESVAVQLSKQKLLENCPVRLWWPCAPGISLISGCLFLARQCQAQPGTATDGQRLGEYFAESACTDSALSALSAVSAVTALCVTVCMTLLSLCIHSSKARNPRNGEDGCPMGRRRMAEPGPARHKPGSAAARPKPGCSATQPSQISGNLELKNPGVT